MTDLDIITEIEAKIHQLPPQIAIEVNDYADFLLQKYQNNSQKLSKKPLRALKNFRTLHPEVISSVDLMRQLRDEQN